MVDVVDSKSTAREGVPVRVRPPVLCRVFITILNTRWTWAIERLFKFLRNFSCHILNGNTLPCVYYYAVRHFLNLRYVQYANKIIMYFKLLRPVFACAMRLMNNNLFHKLWMGQALSYRCTLFPPVLPIFKRRSLSENVYIPILPIGNPLGESVSQNSFLRVSDNSTFLNACM